MADRYHVEAWVSPGCCVGEFEAPTLDAVIEWAHKKLEKRPSATLAFGNIDLADIDDDGLTEEDYERLEEEGLA